MTRISGDQIIENRLINGYDYTNQAWVLNGVYQDCGHPQVGERTVLGDVFEGCICYGRQHAGEATTPNA